MNKAERLKKKYRRLRQLITDEERGRLLDLFSAKNFEWAGVYYNYELTQQPLRRLLTWGFIEVDKNRVSVERTRVVITTEGIKLVEHFGWDVELALRSESKRASFYVLNFDEDCSSNDD